MVALRFITLRLLVTGTTLAASLCIACASHVRPPANTVAPANSIEMTRLYDEDQADRADMDAFLKNAYSNHERLLAQIARDSTRLATVRALVGAGEAHTAADFYHAAMVAQHGADTTAYRQAAEWAARAVALDSTYPSAKWLTAAARDRYLKAIGQPQCYGTQLVKDDQTAPWRLYNVDPKCTDADRRRLGAAPLSVMRAKADSMNAAERAGPR